MSRLTDNDRTFGPITYGRASWKACRLVWSSGGGDEDEPRNSLTVYAFDHVARVYLPNILRPWRQWVDMTKYEWARSEGYWDVHSREYGFSVSDGFLQFYLGPQTGDSTTTKSWSCFLPWTQWHHVRLSYYGLQGEHVWTEEKGGRPCYAIKDTIPAVCFEFDDYDGERIAATTRIKEWEWHFGTGWFRWLRWFRRPMIRRSLELDFDKEVGPEKGSWKGGTTGHSIDMLPGELHEGAFRRYCEQEHRSKSGRFRITFASKAESVS